MGMAASQARYLALVARKSNCEYEGQQINQARTALSNQSANLFNQMLGLKVPIPPNTQDYTKTQYSFTDGINAYTIDSWHQLATPEEEYNYAVTYHYETDVYTGGQKQMSDPQVQFTAGLQAPMETTSAVLKSVTASRIEYDKIAVEYEKLKENAENAIKASEEANLAYETALKIHKEAREAQELAQQELTTATTAYNNYVENTTYTTAKDAVDAAEKILDNADTAIKTKENYKSDDDTIATTVTPRTFDKEKKEYKFGDSNTYTNYSNATDENKALIKKSIDTLIDNGALPAGFDLNNVYMKGSQIAFKEDLDKALITLSEEVKIPLYTLGDAETTNSILNKSESLTTAKTGAQKTYDSTKYKFDLLNAEAIKLEATVNEKQGKLNNADAVLTEANEKVVAAASNKLNAETNLAKANAELEEAEEEHGSTIENYNIASEQLKNYQIPSYIGNCELTLLENLSKDQEAELKQVVADMNKLDKKPAICNAFNEDGVYQGGVFQFKLNGKIYYSYFDDLYKSYESGTGINHIDGQIKLNHYNATYVSTRIDETQKALLQTDEYGRFVSVRFDDNSINYSLKMETVTDEIAYEDAMNKYYYENAVYDKMVQDINAKTSIIQHEDQQLELRLKQLDTEQNALSTEMEAVQKVVKDNVEKSFKTFNG